VTQYAATVEILISNNSTKVKKLTEGLLSFVKEKIYSQASPVVILNESRKLLRFVKQLPPLPELLQLLVTRRQEISTYSSSTFVMLRRLLSQTIEWLPTKYPQLATQELGTVQTSVSIDQIAQLVRDDMAQYGDNIHKEERVVAKLFSRYMTLNTDDSQRLRFGGKVLSLLGAPTLSQTLRDLWNDSGNGHIHVADISRHLESWEQLRVTFEFLHERIHDILTSQTTSREAFIACLHVSYCLSAVITRHIELCQENNERKRGDERERDLYTDDSQREKLLQFYSKTIDLFYHEDHSLLHDSDDISVVLQLSMNILQFLTLLEQPSTDAWDSFIKYLCRLVVDITKAYSLKREDQSTQDLSVEENVKIIIGKTFPVDKELRNRNVLSNESEENNVRIGAGFVIGNKIKFATSRHLPTMRRIGVAITRRYSRLAYGPYIDEPSQDDMGDYTGGMPRIDTIHLDNLILMLDEIGCDEEVFKRLWDVCFELFKIESEMTTFDEMQFCTLKVLTKLLCAMRPREPISARVAKILDVGNNIARPEENYHGTHSKDSVTRYGKSLHELLNSADEYLLKLLPMKDFAESLNVGHVSTSHTTSRLHIHVDSTYLKALFNGFMKSIEDAVAIHKQYNPYLVKELIKSLTLIISRNAELFMAEDVTIGTGGEVTTGNQSYSFDWLYRFFATLYSEPYRDEDWIMRQYLIYGMTKSFSIAYTSNQQSLSTGSSDSNTTPLAQPTSNAQISQQQLQQQNNLQVVFKAIQEALDDIHLRQYGFMSILTLIQHRMTPLINMLLPHLSERIQSWFLDENQTVYVQLLQIRMVTSLVEFYPDSSTYSVTRKAMEALFNVIDRESTSLRVINSIYDALQHLLVNYSLSHFERRLIEALTSFKRPTQKQPRPISMSQMGKSLFSRLQLRNNSPEEQMNNNEKPQIVTETSQEKGPFVPVKLANLMQNTTAKSDTETKPESDVPSSMSRSSSMLSFLGVKKNTNAPPTPSTQTQPTKPAFSLASVGAFFTGKRSSNPQITAPVEKSETKQPETPKQPIVPVVIPVVQPAEEVNKNVHVHSRRVLLLSLMATSMYTSVNSAIASSNLNSTTSNDSNREHKKVNVLQLFEQLHGTKDTHRENEMLLRFIPRLLEDFFDAEQILPLIFGEFLGNKSHPLLLSIVLRIHLPVAYHFEALSLVLAQANNEDAGAQDTTETGEESSEILKRTVSDMLNDARKKSYHNSFGEWIKLSLETLSLKYPPSRALWALLCVFITSCMCYDQHNRATLIEIGAVMPPEHENPVFVHAFLLYGVRFDKCMKEHQTNTQRKTLVRVLQQMAETMAKSTTHQSSWESTTVSTLLSLLEEQ
jgi:hypothetical protein